MEAASDSAWQLLSGEGTVRSPRYYDGPAEISGDVKLSRRCFTYETASGLVVGSDFSVMFTIDRPASAVWPYFKDFTLWQGSHHTYTEVLGDLYAREAGDLGDGRFSITVTPNGPLAPNQYQVLKVIPERLLVIYQPVAEDGANGGVSRGFHVFTLNEHEQRTTITVLMNHAARTTGLSEEQALEPWRKMAKDGHLKWRDAFIPTLKRLVLQAR